MAVKNQSSVDYSIVVPVYYNQDTLRSVMESLRQDVFERNPELTPEVIIVDDGSGDGSLNEALNLQAEEPDVVKVIKLTRNFGQPGARLAGLRYARGTCVVAMSADGQVPPELINDMLQAHLDSHYEVVIGKRTGRDESWYRSVTSRIFFGLMRKLAFGNMPRGGFNFVLLGRKALDVILNMSEAHSYFQGQVLWTGFTPKFIEYHRPRRAGGRSRWTFAKKLTLFLDGILGYSFIPIRFISGMGVVLLFSGVLVAISMGLGWGVWEKPMNGWWGLLCVILVIGGIQTLALGIIGEYLWRTLAQVQNRVPYVIEAIYDQPGGSSRQSS